MGPTPYSNPSFEQATGQVPTTAPINDPGISGRNNSAYPVLDSLAAALQHTQSQVDAANQQLKNTPMYSQGTTYNPTMPVPKPTPFGGSSVQNVAGQQPETRAGARNKAIGQIAGQAGSIIGSYMRKKEAEKTQNLAQDIHRTLELNQGIDEATQVLQSDPNNAAAKAQLQKNQALLKALLDGKNGKAIAKAYDITFGPSAKEEAEKNAKKPEKAAMTGALKQIQQDRAQEFRQQLPSAMGPNPAYETAFKNAEAVQKQADALIKIYTEMTKGVMEVQGRQSVADTAAEARTKSATITQTGEIEKEKLRLQNEIKLQQDKHKDRMAEIGAQGAQRMAQIKEVKKMDGSKGQKMAEDYAKSLTGAITKMQDAIAKNNVTIATKDPSKVAEDARAVAKASNDMLEQSIKQLQGEKDQAVLEMHSDPDAAAMFNILGPGKDEEQ